MAGGCDGGRSWSSQCLLENCGERRDGVVVEYIFVCTHLLVLPNGRYRSEGDLGMVYRGWLYMQAIFLMFG